MTAPAAAPPKSLLGRHRLLAPNAGVHVSPLCLGGMNFGNAWQDFMGECSRETAFEMMDACTETMTAGQKTVSLTWTPVLLLSRRQLHRYRQRLPERRERCIRGEIVLATIITNQFMGHLAREKDVQLSNFGGNSTKSLYTSFDASLGKLKTNYIDIVSPCSPTTVNVIDVR